MHVTTFHQLKRYYAQYKDVEITFTREVIQSTALLQNQIYLKCLGDQWSCIIYSLSMREAKVIAKLNESFFKKLQDANRLVSLRLSFRQSGKADPLSFFITAKITAFEPYRQDRLDLKLFRLSYINLPPDDLIQILGSLIEANSNYKKRKEERIPINNESIQKLGLRSKEAEFLVQEVPRKIILRNISFSGGKMFVFGVGKYLVHKEVELRIQKEYSGEIFKLKGTIIRFEPVEGRRGFTAIVIKFCEDKIPIGYKLMISEYFNQVKKTKKYH